MRKSFTIAKLAAVFLLGGAAMTASAAVTLKEIVPGEEFKIGLMSNGTLYYYQPEQDGVLSITTTCPTSTFLYTSMNSDYDEPNGSSEPCNTNSSPYEFNVKKGTKYYAYKYASNQYGQYTATATFTPSEGGDDNNGDDDQYADFQNMEMTTYTGGASTDIKLKYTAESDGVLTVVQKGSFDSCLFRAMPSSASDYSTLIQPDNGEYTGSASAGYTLKYTLTKDQTVYFISPNGPTGYVTQATFSWEGVKTGFEKIEIGQEYSDLKTIKEFTPDTTGLMEVVYSAFAYGVTGTGFSPIYTNSTCSSSFMLKQESGDDTANGTYTAYYFVTEGETYYFYSDASNASSLKFTVTGVSAQAAPQATVIGVTPTPGKTIDTNDTMLDVAISLSSELSSWSNVSINYTNKEGELTNEVVDPKYIELVAMGMLLDVRIFDKEVDKENPTVYEQIKAKADTELPWQLVVSGMQFKNNAELVAPGATVTGYQYITVKENNELLLEYTFADPPVLVSQSWPEEFLAYWAPGSEDAVVTITLDQEIEAVNEITVVMGKHVWGSEGGGDDPDPSWSFSPKIDGMTVSFDLAGIDYTSEGYSEVTIFVNGIQTVPGFIYPTITKYLDYSSETEGEIPTEMENYATSIPVENFESGTSYSSLENVTLSWNEPVEAVEGMSAAITVKIGNNRPLDATFSVNEEGSMVIDLSEILPATLTFSGNVVINVPSGLVKNSDGLVNKAQELTFVVDIVATEIPIIGGAKATEVVGEEGLEGINIAWEGYRIALNPEFDGESLTVSVAGGNVMPYMDPVVVNNFLYIGLMNPIDESVSLEVYIPAGYVIIGNDEAINAEETVVLNFTFTGVSALGAGNGEKSVYNLQGVKVSDKNLKKGLYIIDGKKVMIK